LLNRIKELSFRANIEPVWNVKVCGTPVQLEFLELNYFSREEYGNNWGLALEGDCVAASGQTWLGAGPKRNVCGSGRRRFIRNITMKTTKRPRGKAKVDLHAVAAAAEKLVEEARKRARLAKAQFKQARKALKQAKKTAKEARKQAKAAAKALKAKAGKPTKKVPAKAAKRAKARGVVAVAAARRPVLRTAAPRPETPETGSQTPGSSPAVPPA
jgi:hypothetical protein